MSNIRRKSPIITGKKDWFRSNLIICNKSQLPKTREWRNAWSISDEVVSGNKETVQSIEYQETEGLDLTEMFSEELNRSKVYA